MTSGDARSKSATNATFERKLTLQEPSTLLTYLSYVLVSLGAMLFAASAYGLLTHTLAKSNPIPLAFDLVVFGAVLSVLRKSWRTKKRPATVRADDQGAWIDGKLAVARNDIVQGTFQPGETPSVRLTGKRGAVLLSAAVEGEAQALEVLHALDLDAGKKRAEFRAAGMHISQGQRTMFVALPMMGLFFLMGALHAGAVMPLFALAGVALAMFVGWPGKIIVGADGVLVKTRFKDEFYPMAQIKDCVALDDAKIGLVLTSGKTVPLLVTARRTQGYAKPAILHRETIRARIIEAIGVHRAHGTNVDVSALVGRGTRTGEEWIGELRKLRDRVAGYRDLVVRDEDLFRVVEDPAATEDARAGAALLLRSKLDDEGRARIRVAADAAASPKLRVALDAAVRDEGEAANAEAEQAVLGIASER